MCFLLFPNSTIEVSPLHSNHVQNKFIRSFSLSTKLKGKKKYIKKKKINTETTLLDCFYALAVNKENITLFHLSHVTIPDSINLCLGFETWRFQHRTCVNSRSTYINLWEKCAAILCRLASNGCNIIHFCLTFCLSLWLIHVKVIHSFNAFDKSNLRMLNPTWTMMQLFIMYFNAVCTKAVR